MGLKLINHLPDIEQDADRIGTFYIEYTIRESWDQLDVDEMGDWLAENCTENYIYTRDLSHIIGGGSYPVKGRWMRYKKLRLRSALNEDGVITCYRIRLNQQDDLLFRLTWLADL